MFGTRLSAALAGSAALIASAVIAGPAQASTTTTHTIHAARSVTLVMPAAPAGPSRSSGLATNTSAPGISPATSTTHLAPGQSVQCTSGNLCPVVWDPTTGSWKVFFLFSCHRYSVSYWHSNGVYADAQTGSVWSSLYGQTGNLLLRFQAPTSGSYNWDAVWSIQNC